MPCLRHAAVFAALAFALAACGDRAKLNVAETMGPAPVLPPPVHRLIPTVNVVTASSWPEGATPVAAPGLSVQAFARGLDHPRWLALLPNGDVLVAETNAPERPKDNPGIKGYFFKLFQKKAGGAVPSANRIVLLRDADGDGVAETRSILISGLNSPFGMQLSGGTLYVADTDAVLAFPYHDGDTVITAPPRKLLDLPAGPINHHWTKNLIVSPDGTRMYVSIGSNSNVGDNGIPAEQDRAQIWLVDPSTGEHRPFATGIRNPVGLAFEPATGALWTAVNERDEIGSDLVPDYMTHVEDGGFYGWPFSYYGQHVDGRIKPRDRRPDLVGRAIVPDYALGAHTASLGLAFSEGARLGPPLATGAFVGQHGSWNRKPRSGYKVIFVPFSDGRPSGAAVDVLTGFVTPDGHAMGRPVGVTVDKAGALLVADDVGNTVWRVTAAR
jgi:glucose/arabinose dehydrogenase